MFELLPLVLAATVSGSDKSTEGPPIACRPQALSKEDRNRQRALLEYVRSKVKQVVNVENGVALLLPTDAKLFRDVSEWVGLERRCCPFIAFTLEWKRDDTITVQLSGGPGVQEAVAAEMGLSTSP